MIDEGVFRNEWALLCERFGRYEGSRAIAQRYYEYLSPRLGTETFVAAARRLFAEEEFFPRPARFFEVSRPSLEAEAQREWETALELIRGDSRALDRLSPEGRRVVRVMGGASSLQDTLKTETQWRRKEFLELYGTGIEDPPKALPAGEALRRLPADCVPGRLLARDGRTP